MKLSLGRLSADGLVLDLPNDAQSTNHVELSRGAGVRGTYQHDHREIRLDGVTADELQAAVLSFHLSEGRSVAVSPLVLEGAALELVIARGALEGRARTSGSLAAKSLSAKAIGLDLGDQRVRTRAISGQAVRWSSSLEGMTAGFDRLGGNGLSLAIRSIELEIEDFALGAASLAMKPSELRVQAGGVELRGVRASFGSLKLQAESIALTDVAFVRSAGGRPAVSAARAVVRGVDVIAGDAHVHIDQLELRAGVSYEDDRFHAPHAAVGEAVVEVVLPSQGAGAAQKKAPAGAAPGWRFLNGLFGRVEVDVIVDAKVPVINRRRATHKLRVGIEQGIIDFKELEHGLSLLEDAILDFEFEGDRLILEKDLPLIPFDNETLVFWMLDDEGKALAKAKKVRLSTLVKPQVPAKPAETAPKKKSGFELVKLDLDPINVGLRLLGPATFVLPSGGSIRLGRQDVAAVGALEVQGAVRYRAEGAEPGHVDLRLGEVCVGLERVRLGGRSLSIGDLGSPPWRKGGSGSRGSVRRRHERFFGVFSSPT